MYEIVLDGKHYYLPYLLEIASRFYKHIDSIVPFNNIVEPTVEIMQKYYLMVYNKILEDKSDKSFLDCIDETLLTDMSPITLAKTGLNNGYNGDTANQINQLINDTFKINLVTCGNCGKIMSHEVGVEGDLTCVDCGRNGEQSDFPDLFY